LCFSLGLAEKVLRVFLAELLDQNILCSRLWAD
jgi:hypothetical protein